MPFPGIYPPPFPCDVPVATLSTELATALGAYAKSPPDLVGFYAASSRADLALACVRSPLPSATTAELYEVEAILSYVTKDDESATAFLRGAHALGGALPARILANTPKLAELDRAAVAASTGKVKTLQAPLGAKLLVDGSEALAHPADRPYLLQVVWEDGKVHWTGLVPADLSPDLASLGPPPPPVAAPVCPKAEVIPCPSCPEPARGPSKLLAVGALGTTAAAVGLYGLTGLYYKQFYDQKFDSSFTDEEVAASRDRANLFQWAAIGAGAVGAGLDVTLVIQMLRGDGAR